MCRCRFQKCYGIVTTVSLPFFPIMKMKVCASYSMPVPWLFAGPVGMTKSKSLCLLFTGPYIEKACILSATLEMAYPIWTWFCRKYPVFELTLEMNENLERRCGFFYKGVGLKTWIIEGQQVDWANQSPTCICMCVYFPSTMNKVDLWTSEMLWTWSCVTSEVMPRKTLNLPPFSLILLLWEKPSNMPYGHWSISVQMPIWKETGTSHQ